MDVSELARRLAALPASAMRQAVLREALLQASDEEAARLCGALVRRGRDGAPYDLALLALHQLIDAGGLGYERVEALYRAARERGDAGLQRILLSAVPPPPGRPRAALLPTERPLTLGEKKSLARRSRREVLERLLRDPEPSVIAILLGNPRVTEEDVVRLATRRPTTAEAQRLICASERFIPRYAVKRALAFNPYTPSDLAARLASLLNATDLRSIAADGALADPVREAARELLGRSTD